eukprot:6192862-Pleurochrysis_carterae.AAC.1
MQPALHSKLSKFRAAPKRLRRASIDRKKRYQIYIYNRDMVDPDDPLNNMCMLIKTNLTDKATAMSMLKSNRICLPHLMAPIGRPTP